MMMLRYTDPHMRGDDVLWVQRRLVEHGIDPGKLDGIFGIKTSAAVKEFQIRLGMYGDGMVCKMTREALAADPAAPECTEIISDFLAYLREQLGHIYVWGAQGEIVKGASWIRSKESNARNAARAEALFKLRMSQGMDPIRAYDCSGLIVRFLLDHGLIKWDLSSRDLYRKCAKINNRVDLLPGDLVFRHDGIRIYHVGVFMGNGMVIESKGRDDGVVEREMNASGTKYWNRYGRLPELEGYYGR